ncbi:hypothetical protein KP003_20160 [Geomonas nitrogeniifigens]|uniref:hypothetical protein n=1 Tax=Geomonas diazotrophica TaxID=2843197 RepID=UPI001C2C8C31|nr:hypothetical protein [Geomonas nitrogeniifigens]QXE86632.1 hypothetical protein KP003_20160 [Geomonas nitrogeniifigens]
MSASERPFAKLWLPFWLLLALAGIATWVVLLNGAEEPRAWRSLLINFLFFTSLAGGMVVWPPLVATCNGRWHLKVERLASVGIAFALPSLAALVLLWVGNDLWAPWQRVHYHQGIWLHPDFLLGRDLAGLLIFWGAALYHLNRRRSGEGKPSGAVLVLIYCLVFSLLGFDLVMALDPYWHSNLAGGYFFMSGLYIAITCWALLAASHPAAEPDQLHDLGKLMVAFSLMTTYLMYAHLLPFWYENLPREVRFIVPRLHGPQWAPVSAFLLALVYFGPLVLLLPVRAKRSRLALGAISFLVLCGLWLERWWLVAPTFEQAPRLGLPELSLAAGFAGVLGLGMTWMRRVGEGRS